jgi:CO/xanthine dehydrogenase Mo-binding subunit
VGGGFGGKVDVIVEPIAALAAMHTGRPVKYMYTRQEEMQVSSTRSAVRVYITDGVMADGTIVSREVTSYIDCGAYSRQTPYSATKHAANVCGPYTIPNVAIDVHCVFTNRQPASAMRGFGVTEASFALEMQMDRVARELGVDPWELRLRNAYRNGEERPHRKITEDASLVETIQAAAERAGVELSAELRAMSSNDREEVAR